MATRPGLTIGRRIGGPLLWSAAALLATPAAAAAQAAPPSPPQPAARQASAGAVAYAIPAGPLGAALNAWAEASRLKLLAPTELVRGRGTHGVRGSMAPEQALQALIGGSGLTYHFANATTVVIREPAAAATSGAVEGEVALDMITVQGGDGTVGYVATRTGVGTKTDTPLIETPQSISVVTDRQMAAQAVESVAGALRYTPGVSGETFGVDTRGYGLQIRGFNASDYGFYLDGLQFQGSSFATYLNLEPYGAQQIDVLRGPSSVLYGQATPGGIVNYVSKRPLDVPHYEVEGGGGSFDQIEGKFDIGGPAVTDKTWLYRVTGLIRDSDTQVDFVDHDRIFIAPALTWRPNIDTSLTILSHYQQDKTGWAMQYLPAHGTVLSNPNGRIPTNRFVGEPDFDKYDVTQYSIGYAFEHHFTDVWTVRQNARFAHLDNTQEGVFGSGLEPDMRTYTRYADEGTSTLDGVTIDTQMQAEFDTGALDHRVLFGIDYQRSSYTDWAAYADMAPIDLYDPRYNQPVPRTRAYMNNDTTQQQLGLYAQEQLTAGNWVLTLGGRQDWAETNSRDRVGDIRSDQNDSAFTGRAGLTYLTEFGVAPYIAYSTSFLPLLGTTRGGSAFVPETGEQYEAGVKYQPAGWNAFMTFAAFDLTRQNTLTTDPSNVNFQVQTGEVRSRGIEVEAVASLDFGLDVRAAYTYLDTKITKDNDGNRGNTPYGVPQHRASIWADYTVPDGTFTGWGVGGGARFIGWTYGDDTNTFKVPGVTLFDAALHYEWKSLKFQINANNVFDRQYVATCFAESFGCFYGERRNVIGTVRYRW